MTLLGLCSPPFSLCPTEVVEKLLEVAWSITTMRSLLSLLSLASRSTFVRPKSLFARVKAGRWEAIVSGVYARQAERQTAAREGTKTWPGHLYRLRSSRPAGRELLVVCPEMFAVCAGAVPKGEAHLPSQPSDMLILSGMREQASMNASGSTIRLCPISTPIPPCSVSVRVQGGGRTVCASLAEGLLSARHRRH